MSHGVIVRTTGPLSPVPMTPRGVPLTGTHAGVLSGHVNISVVDENINEDVSSKQYTCSLRDCSYFSVHWFIESGVHVDTVHVARVIFNYIWQVYWCNGRGYPRL